jgi:hypothetical protein
MDAEQLAHGWPDWSAQKIFTVAMLFASRFQNYSSSVREAPRREDGKGLTRTYPFSENPPLLRCVSETVGLTGRGSITSVKVTVLGTVSSIRARSVAQVEPKRLGEFANARMVMFPSLEKMRASERVVMFGPTTRGLFV